MSSLMKAKWAAQYLPLEAYSRGIPPYSIRTRKATQQQQPQQQPKQQLQPQRHQPQQQQQQEQKGPPSSPHNQPAAEPSLASLIDNAIAIIDSTWPDVRQKLQGQDSPELNEIHAQLLQVLCAFSNTLGISATDLVAQPRKNPLEGMNLDDIEAALILARMRAAGRN